MRRILVDMARLRRAQKRGGDDLRVTLTGELAAPASDPVDVLTLNTALLRLQDLDPRQADVIELSYFGGLTQPEIGEAARHLAGHRGPRPAPCARLAETGAGRRVAHPAPPGDRLQPDEPAIRSALVEARPRRVRRGRRSRPVRTRRPPRRAVRQRRALRAEVESLLAYDGAPNDVISAIIEAGGAGRDRRIVAARRADAAALRRQRRARPGRDGRGLEGHRSHARPRRGDQGAAVGGVEGPVAPGAVRSRGQGAGVAEPQRTSPRSTACTNRTGCDSWRWSTSRATISRCTSPEAGSRCRRCCRSRGRWPTASRKPTRRASCIAI